MSINDLLLGPLTLGYDPSAGPAQPAQVALRGARADLSEEVPPGYRVRVSGAAVNLPRVPWVAVLDEDVTPTAQEGFYLVYLFSTGLDRAYLSMNQGVTVHLERFRGMGRARPGVAAVQELTRESILLRNELGTDISDLQASISLQDDGTLARGYEAGNIAARGYDARDLPAEGVLRADLERFLSLYRDVIAARDRVLIEQPGSLHVPTRSRASTSSAPNSQEPVFRPKDASDYVANVPPQRQRRTRKHEDLVRRFGEHARATGWTAATNVHPCDLVLRRAPHEVIVEAKTVGNNAEFAVRDAIGQLFAYRHFLYRARGQTDPMLLALFSEPVGNAFVVLLADLGIEAAWFSNGELKGSVKLD